MGWRMKDGDWRVEGRGWIGVGQGGLGGMLEQVIKTIMLELDLCATVNDLVVISRCTIIFL